MLFGFPMLALAALFAWGGLHDPAPSRAEGAIGKPAVILSEQLGDGLIEAQVYLPGDLTYRIDIQFSPDAASTVFYGARPDVVFAMADMHMDGFDPPLELVGTGAWRTQGKVPMAGRWILSVGYGEDFAEVMFLVK